MRRLLLAALLCGLTSQAGAWGWGPWPRPAFGGGVLLCNEWGCRGSPYLPVPPVPQPPYVVYSPMLRPPPPGPRPFIEPRSNPPVGVVAAPPAPSPGQAPARPPKPSKAEVAEQEGIESDIMAFCDSHPDERFCGRLGQWLRDHPDAHKAK